MRIVMRTSRTAVWSRRLAGLALPLMVLALLLHYGGAIEASAFLAAEALGALLAAIGLLLSLYALVGLWFSGERGWGLAIGALVLSLVCLSPAAAAAWTLWHYPTGSDLTTDAGDPPVLLSAAPETPRGADSAELARAYPGLRARNYRLDGPDVFTLVSKIVEDRGWQVLRRAAPASGFDSGEINAVAVALGGWQDEVAVRVRGNGQGSVVDMRSAALAPGPDFGANGRRIESFLAELDSRVAEAMRSGPANIPDDNGAPDIIGAPQPAPPPGPGLQDPNAPDSG